MQYSDLDTVLAFIEDMTESQKVPIALVGFSLGAISLGKFMASRGENVPDSVVCACLVSGSFSMDLADGWRYRSTFQPLIVPKMVGEFGRRCV